MADLVNESQSPHAAAGAAGDIQMDGRESFELERRFGELSPEDAAFLKSKGISTKRTTGTLLTGSEGAFDLPPRDLQTKIIDAYFEWVNPQLPVVNRTWFLNEFRNFRTPSRLLLFAIFTAGCKVCRIPALLDKKGTSHESGRRFYKITKVYYPLSVLRMG
jgi:hypothetical protein